LIPRGIAGWRLAALVACMACHLGIARAQVSEESRTKAMQDYEETLRQGDAMVAAGNPFEAVRLYEHAGRIAYNNKLPVDATALDQKLKSARAGRDAKQKAPSVPAPSNPPSSAPSSRAPSSSGNPAMLEYEESVRHGDELAAAGEFGDSVRAYEKARRVAANNKLNIDRSALDAKIAAVANARNTPRATAELIPAPLPPLPPQPDSEPGPRYLWQRPGKLRPWSLSAHYTKAEMHVTNAELKAFEANLHKVMDVFAKTPVLSPPMGFELDVKATLDSMEDVKERARNIANHLPLHGSIRFSGSSYLEIQLRSKSTGALSTGVGISEEAYCRYEIRINVPPLFNSFISDSEGTIFLEPKKEGMLGTLPVYAEDDTLVIARPGIPVWVPVSTERVLKFLLPKLKSSAALSQSAIDGARKAYADYMSPAAQESRRREVQAQRDAGAEENARKLEGMQRRWEEDKRKEAERAPSDPKWLGPINEYQRAQTMLATLDTAGRSAPACVIAGTTRSTENDWSVVPMGTPGCRPVVQSNPGLLNNKLPRSALQVMYISQVTRCNSEFEEKKYLRNKPGDCVAMAKILREVDWQQLVALLAR
jgi:hypothetical protein